MFSYDARGIKLNGSEFWLDAHRKVSFSFISHGHADHIKNHDAILATPPTVQFHARRARQKKAIPLAFGESFSLDGMNIELYPAGHVLGSAMIRIESDGLSLLYTGDFKIKKSWTASPIEIPPADVLIMESTFGHPDFVYNQTPEYLANELFEFVQDCFHAGIQPIILAYSLGKAQEAMKILGDAGYNVCVHKSAWEIAKVYQHFGVEFNHCALWKEEPLEPRQVLILPPHSFKYKKVKNLPYRRRTVFLSGWANSENGIRFGGDHCIPLSDHADFQELLDFVKQVNPQKVYTTHGFEEFPFHLRDLGYDAELLKETGQTSLF